MFFDYLKLNNSMNREKAEPPAKMPKQLLVAGIVLLLFACNQAPEKGQRVQGELPVPDEVSIRLKKEEKSGPPKKKIFITFDDGPNKGTQNVLNILREEDVPATFFVIGQHTTASPYQALMWDSLKAGKNLELANHSYSHAWRNKFNRFYQHPDSVVSDFNRAHVQLALNNFIARTPGRNVWRIDSLHRSDNPKNKVALDHLQKNGYVLVGWDLEWHFDRKTLGAKQSADELMGQIDSLFAKKKTLRVDNLVLLAHDQMYKRPDDSLKLRTLIRKIKSRPDYEFALVSDYPGIKEQLDKQGKN